MEDDRYKTPCSVWYKHLEVPSQLAGSANPDCCFAFTIAGADQYICMQQENHCQILSYQVMKTLRKGCLAGPDGNQLSSGPSVNGELRKPETEITGEGFKVSKGLQDALG